MPKYSVLKNKTNSDFSKFVLFLFGGAKGNEAIESKERANKRGKEI